MLRVGNIGQCRCCRGRRSAGVEDERPAGACQAATGRTGRGVIDADADDLQQLPGFEHHPHTRATQHQDDAEAEELSLLEEAELRVADTTDHQRGDRDRRGGDARPAEEAGPAADEEVEECEGKGLENHESTGERVEGNAMYHSRKTPFCQCKKAFFVANLSRFCCL